MTKLKQAFKEDLKGFDKTFCEIIEANFIKRRGILMWSIIFTIWSIVNVIGAIYHKKSYIVMLVSLFPLVFWLGWYEKVKENE